MGLKITQVDAFTNKPFGGNPAGVCILAEPGEAEWMQKVAQEMNLAETAFLYKQADGYSLRWFTPAVEVDLCGHATLASAHVLWEEGHLNLTAQARFHTKSGLLTAERKGDWIEMDFPSQPAEKTTAPEMLLEALGVRPTYVGRNQPNYIVQLESEAQVRAIAPDMKLLKSVTPAAMGVIVTSRATSPEFDFVSRYFAPAAGIDEDPVTGSAHCTLATFWQEQLSKAEMVGYQASARGGVVKVRVAGERVFLGGQAVTVLRGELA